MAIIRNEFGEDRVVPTLGYHLVPDGDTVIVPDEELEHWIAGGWILVPADAPAPATPAVAPAATAKTATAPEPERAEE